MALNGPHLSEELGGLYYQLLVGTAKLGALPWTLVTLDASGIGDVLDPDAEIYRCVPLCCDAGMEPRDSCMPRRYSGTQASELYLQLSSGQVTPLRMFGPLFCLGFVFSTLF